MSAAAFHRGSTHFMQGREPFDLANRGRSCAARPAAARPAAPDLVRGMQAVRAADTLFARHDAPIQTVSARFSHPRVGMAQRRAAGSKSSDNVTMLNTIAKYFAKRPPTSCPKPASRGEASLTFSPVGPRIDVARNGMPAADDDLYYIKWRRLRLPSPLATGFRSRPRPLPRRQAHRHRA